MKKAMITSFHQKTGPPIKGSLEAISKAKNQGFYIIVVSNQSALGRGWMSIEDLNSINRKMQSALAKFGGKIDAFLFCPHDPADKCNCRKPKTALLDSFRARTGINYKDCPFVGDRISDIEVAKKIGARPILVHSGKVSSNPHQMYPCSTIWPKLCKTFV